MPSQEDILGAHPSSPNIFDTWFTPNDFAPTPTFSHRSLESNLPANEKEIINWLARKIIQHHHTQKSLQRLQKKYKEMGFGKVASQYRRIPITDRTKKGNATEIILIEYIESCINKADLVKVFRFRYNTNVDQAMKGDDALIIERVKDKNDFDDVRVYLGEAKFRGKPDNAVLNELSSSLGKDKLPLSYSFLVDRLYEDPATESLAELLEEFVIDEIKAKGNLMYAGFLLSTKKTSAFVEKNFKCDNASLVFISAGIDTPADLVNNAFIKAQELIENDLV